jgi:hypothetical protein
MGLSSICCEPGRESGVYSPAEGGEEVKEFKTSPDHSHARVDSSDSITRGSVPTPSNSGGRISLDTSSLSSPGREDRPALRSASATLGSASISASPCREGLKLKLVATLQHRNTHSLILVVGGSDFSSPPLTSRDPQRQPWAAPLLLT